MDTSRKKSVRRDREVMLGALPSPPLRGRRGEAVCDGGLFESKAMTILN
jgi:hypothetical protein